MKYMYWISAVLVLALGLYFSTHLFTDFFAGPQSISKISFSQFSTPEEFGKAAFEHLRLEVKQAPIIFLGVTPNQVEDLELWRGFLEANQEPGSKYDVIVVESMLPFVEIFNNSMHLQIKEELPRLFEGISKARKEGLRVAVIVPTIYASQLIKNNTVHKLKEDYKLDITSLVVSKFPLTRAQEESFEPRCYDGGAVDPAGTSALGCMVRNLSRPTYRKKFEPNKYSGFLEQVGPKDFLILFNRN